MHARARTRAHSRRAAGRRGQGADLALHLSRVLVFGRERVLSFVEKGEHVARLREKADGRRPIVGDARLLVVAPPAAALGAACPHLLKSATNPSFYYTR